MRRLIGAALAVVTALLVLVAPPASAGGPTSVLIVNYDGARASGALTGSTMYDALQRALDAMNPPTGDTAAPAGLDENRHIRLVWMIHDVTPWRIDSVTVNGSDIWVNTILDPTDGVSAGRPGTWHRPKDAALLLSTLTSLGVIGAAKPGAADTGSLPAPAGPVSRSGEPISATDAPNEPRAASWVTLLAVVLALALGSVLGSLVGPTVRRSLSRSRRTNAG